MWQIIPYRDVKEEIKKRKNRVCKRLMRNGTGTEKLDLSGNISTESGADILLSIVNT